MRLRTFAFALLGAGLLAQSAVGADNEAGKPLTSDEAAGAWTLGSSGHDLCTLTLSADMAAKSPGTCGVLLSAVPTRWAPTSDGMKLVAADGQTVISFSRWSNSLFVSKRAGGGDIQLRRGGPNP